MTYKLSFGQYQLTVSLGHKRGRPKRTSIILRRLFENKKTRQVFGINLTIFVLLTGIMAPPISALTGNPETEIVALPTRIQLTTEDSVQLPLDSFNVSQGYHFFHRAIDFKEIIGAPVYPIMEGVVEQVVNRHFGYGNYVVIDHGSGFKSLYAHLAKIVVAEDEEVNQNTVLGTIGSTGWATGSHLHLEVYDNSHPFNPLTILK